MSSDPLSAIEGPLADAIEIAQAECVRMAHESVDVAHLFLGLLQAFPEGAQKLFGPAGLRRDELIEAVRAALPPGRKARAAREAPDGTPALFEVMRIARELMRGDPFRFEHGMAAITRQKDNLPKRVLSTFGVDPKSIETASLAILAAKESPVTDDDDDDDLPGPTVVAAKPKKDSFLATLAKDLIERAKSGAMDPVIGRDREIEAVLETLARRTKNNPVLVGEPGVGKSAIVEGLAQRIAAGRVPPRLKNLKLFELSTADLVAGTQYRGDFEARILKLVDETSRNPDYVLFIDEIHTILAAGGQQGTGDAAALLKPHLARGEVRCIGASTTDEYRKFIEKDRALVRRFQPINVPEPTIEECVLILRGIAGRFEEHHGVKLDPRALEAAVHLSVKHMPERYLPDKAIDLIDQSCARKVIRAPADFSGTLTVTREDIAELLRDQLGKNLGEVTVDEGEKLLGIEEFLRSRVVGQDHVAERVADRLRLTKRELDFRPERPSGVFLFLGPTGVGKTEVARCLAEYMLGSQRALIRYDLSEFAEQHSVAKIVGSPPGYVGYEDEGHQLTSKIRSNPQTILLLDEIEKAHPSVLNLFLQVFEDGRLTDAQGRTVSFSEVTIILTSNIGAEAFRQKASIGFTQPVSLPPEEVRAQAKEVLAGRLPPELLNRVDEVLVFNPLGPKEINRIAERLVERAIERFGRDNKAIEVEPSAIQFLGETGYDPAYGARHLTRNVEQLLLQPLARETYLSDWDRVEKIKVSKVGSALVFEKVHRRASVAHAGAKEASAESS